MCGINAYISKDLQEDISLIERMNAAIQQRGPDATGYRIFPFEKQNLHLGANRLKIIDLHNQGNQPMCSPDGRYALAYNGEIYNYAALRIPLHQKYKFVSATDTEVLLYHLIEHGEAGLSQLEGMFAFIFVDRREEKILVARDRSGIKPLFYAQQGNELLISSEIKGIFASGKVEKKINTAQLAEYLHFKAARQPETLFEGVKELPQGHLLTYGQGKLALKPWHTSTVSPHKPESRRATVRETEALLLTALERHLRADVPAGLLLSGGVDSTLLLALLHKLGVKDFPCFTVAHLPGAHTTSDYAFASRAVKQFQASPNVLEANADMLSRFSEHISFMDQPVGDSAALMTFLLCEEAKEKGVKVLLSGAGADELFAGYNRHHAYYRYLKQLKDHPSFISLLKKFDKFIPSYHSAFRLAKKFIQKVDVHPDLTWENFCSQDDLLCQLLPLPERPLSGLVLSTEEWLHKGLQDDRSRYLVADILAITDRMSMARSVEVRVPYLDQTLVDFSDTLPPSYLLQHGQKWILKRLLIQNGGAEYAHRKKEGFGLPFQYWLDAHSHHPLIEQLKNPKAVMYRYIAYEKVQEILTLHLSHKRNLAMELWTLIVLAEWLEQQFS